MKQLFNLKLNYSPKYLPQLDGIRGIAVCFVILYHCFPCDLTRAGWMGVDLFFVLSGFLITGILIDTRTEKKYYINFIGRRVLRIFPLYYGVLLIIFLLMFFFGRVFPVGSDYYLRHQSWFWLYFQNWLYSRDGFPPNHMLVHFWTLGVEEQFYLLWPWVIRYIRPKYVLKVSIVLCVIAIGFRLLPLNIINLNETYRYMSTISRMDSLLIGAIIAILIRNNTRLLEKVTVPICIGSFIIVLLGIMYFKSLSFLRLSPIFTFIDLFAGSILVISLSSFLRFQSFIAHPILIKLGKYSYGLYVYHYIIFVLLKHHLDNWLNYQFSNFYSRMIILGSLTILLAIPISIISYHLFENKFLVLKKYFSYKHGVKKDVAVLSLDKIEEPQI